MLDKVTAGFFLRAFMFLQPLTLALAYIFAQENPNQRMTFYIITFSTKYLPYAMLAMTFVTAGPTEAMRQATGLLAAHSYDYLTRIWPQFGGGRNYIQTPEIVRRWFARPPASAQSRAYGTAFQGRPAGAPPAQNVGRPGGGWASGFSSGWNGRSGGRRLGGD